MERPVHPAAEPLIESLGLTEEEAEVVRHQLELADALMRQRPSDADGVVPRRSADDPSVAGTRRDPDGNGRRSIR